MESSSHPLEGTLPLPFGIPLGSLSSHFVLCTRESLSEQTRKGPERMYEIPYSHSLANIVFHIFIDVSKLGAKVQNMYVRP